jgi:RNA polymerase sigma-70 factor (ECF subfamily)
MIEGRRLVAGEAILSGAATVEQSKEAMLEALVRQHSRLVYRIAYAVLRRHQDAEDATQETFLRVLRYSSKLAKVEDPKTWLARIAWRVAVDRAKHSAGKEIPFEDGQSAEFDIATTEPAVDLNILGNEASAAIEKLIAVLPEKLRQPLILSALEEMSPREVAGTLGISEAAVRSRVFRARQILKEKLAAQMGER